MHFPTWIDLKGEDSVPDTVHHVVVTVDPRTDMSWHNLPKRIPTDGVHANDRLVPTSATPGNNWLSHKIYFLMTIRFIF